MQRSFSVSIFVDGEYRKELQNVQVSDAPELISKILAAVEMPGAIVKDAAGNPFLSSLLPSRSVLEAYVTRSQLATPVRRQGYNPSVTNLGTASGNKAAFSNYNKACCALATTLAPHTNLRVAVGEARSGSLSNTLEPLLRLLSADEDELSTLWNHEIMGEEGTGYDKPTKKRKSSKSKKTETVVSDQPADVAEEMEEEEEKETEMPTPNKKKRKAAELTYCATAAAMLLHQFNDLKELKNASELTWGNQFYGLLTLGGHRINSIRLDGNVPLQGALALPKMTKFVRPDFCIGPRVNVGVWASVCAGKAQLPLDIGEYKSALALDDKWDRLVYASLVCVHQQLDLIEAFKSAEKISGASNETLKFPTAFPIAFSTLMHGDTFRLACVWQSSNPDTLGRKNAAGMKMGGVEVCTLAEITIDSKSELQRCFLLRREVIKIVQDVGKMLEEIFNACRSVDPPRQDLWWQRHCICGQPADDRLYVCCDECGRWLHCECVKLESPPEGKWICPVCSRKLKASAEPQEANRDPESDGGLHVPALAASISTLSLNLRPIERLFENRTTEVWLCRDVSQQKQEEEGKLVAAKVMHSPKLAEREAKILMALRDLPNVTQLLGVVDFKAPNHNIPCRALVFPYYDFHSATQLESDQVFASYAKQLLQALADVHKRGIVHHDISPNNVIFVPAADQGATGRTVVLDFGYADTKIRPVASWWGKGAQGTRGFIAPEVRAYSNCGLKIDVWSAGSVLAFQLLGLWPQTDEEADLVAQMAYTDAVEWVQAQDAKRWFWPSVPGPFMTPSRWAFVRKMMARYADQRLDSASALAQFDHLWGAHRMMERCVPNNDTTMV